MNVKYILIADNDPVSRKSLSDVLSLRGYVPVAVGTGKSALNSLKEVRPALALIDLKLGDLSGLELLQEIKNRSPETECIVLTGHASPASGIKAVNLGAYSYLQEPYDMEHLLLLIGGAMQKLEANERRGKNEECVRLAIQGAGDGLWDWPDISQDEEWWSPKYYELLGYQTGEIKSSHSQFTELLHSDDKDRVVAALQAHLEKQTPYDIDYRLKTKGGEYRWFRGRGQALWGEEGNPYRVSGSIRDITKRLWTEKVLEQRASQLALLNDIGRQIAGVLDLGNILDRAARLVQESFGYHHVALFTLDRERNELVMKARAGAFANLFPLDHRLEFGQGMVGWVVIHGQKLLANDVRSEPRHFNPFPEIIPTRSELTVPIRVGEAVVGVLDVQSPHLNGFDENDMLVMDTLADQIAIAIENARLYAVAQQELAERKRTEKALRQSEEKYRSLFNGMPIGLYRTTPAGQILTVNPACVQTLGYPSMETLLAVDVINLYAHPEDRQRWQALLEHHGEVYNFDVQLKRYDGTIIWLRENTRTVRDEKGQIRYYEGTIRDITDRKRVEEIWNKYEFIINTSLGFLTIINKDHVYEAVNNGYCQAHNKSREEIVGSRVTDIWGADKYLNHIKAHVDWCFAGNEVHYQDWFEFSALGKRYMDVTYYPYHNGNGNVTQIVVISRDVTIDKQAEEALQNLLKEKEAAYEQMAVYTAELNTEISERHWVEKELERMLVQNEQLLTSIPLILIGVEYNNRVTHWNKPAEIAFNIKSEDVIGQSFFDSPIYWDWAKINQGFANCEKNSHLTPVRDIRYTRHDGREGFLNITVTRFGGETAGQLGFLLIGEDITDRKLLESQLVQAQKLEAIGQLTAGIAHEINTPTQYIGDNVGFLQEAFTKISDILETYQHLLATVKAKSLAPELIAEIERVSAKVRLDYLLEEIPLAIEDGLEGIDRVTKIVQAMKDFSHPGVEERTAIDLNKTIASTITVARNEWKYVADIETMFDPDLPDLLCLPGELNQAILNILINAAHAIGDVVGDGSEGKGVISITTRHQENWAEIRISDTGTGIPEAVRQRIFDPFFTTKEVGRGTGQGLAIAHSVIVEKHGGTITFETEENKGTTFIIRLPLKTSLEREEEETNVG